MNKYKFILIAFACLTIMSCSKQPEFAKAQILTIQAQGNEYYINEIQRNAGQSYTAHVLPSEGGYYTVTSRGYNCDTLPPPIACTATLNGKIIYQSKPLQSHIIRF